METTAVSEATTINTAVIEYSVTEAAMEELEAQYPLEAIPADLSIKENYTYVKKGIAHIRGLRSEVETHRKGLKKDALEYGRKVDAAAKTIKDRLLAIEAPMKDAKTAYDTEVEIKKREAARKEEERIDAIASRITKIKAAVEANISSDSGKIKQVIDKIAQVAPKEWADEFTEKAEAVIAETMEKLHELLAMKEKAEKAAEIAARTEKKRKEEEERARVEHEKELVRLKEENEREAKRLAEEKAKLQKEKEAIEAEKRRKAEEERKGAEEERHRKEEERKKAETEKSTKLAKENEEKNIHDAIGALERFIGLDKVDAVLTAIRNDEIPHVRWIS
jgi:hypothetical protein